MSIVAGQKIIEGLKEAMAGNFTRVTIGGQHWVREDDLRRDMQAIMAINNTLRETLLEVRGFINPNEGSGEREVLNKIDAVVRP